MKILRIAGKNLASLSDPFEVDFQAEPLASAGLFAISGPTGAGKSTLLDALCVALYGRTPRLERQSGQNAMALPDVGDTVLSIFDARTLLRRGAGEAYAEVDFQAVDGKAYRARWRAWRAGSKASGKLQAATVSLHALPELTPMGGKNSETLAAIEGLIGLSFEQFTRAILLAQNQFAAFLKSEESERGELLETLTGSAIYGDISRRAFERNKQEAEVLRSMEAELKEQRPLSEEERAAATQSLHAGEAELKVREIERESATAAWRWWDTAHRLHEAVRLADTALQAAQVNHEAASGRQQHLRAVEAAQAARPLVNDLARSAAAAKQAEDAITAATNALNEASTQVAVASTAWDAAQSTLKTRTTERADAQILLDQAKALDARLHALEPRLSKARGDAAAAGDANEAARHAGTSIQATLTQLHGSISVCESWIANHQHDAPLSAQWPRWEALLTRAAGLASHLKDLEADVLSRQAALAACETAANTAGMALHDAQTNMAAAQHQRTEAQAAAAAVDVHQLSEQRQQLEARRDIIQVGVQRWQEWQRHLASMSALRGRQQELDAHRSSIVEALTPLHVEVPVLMAVAATAAKALRQAELACAENTRSLRAQLQEGEPCPVCGSTEHPNHDADARLSSLLAQFAADAAAADAKRDANKAQMVRLEAELAAARGEVSRLESTLASIETTCKESETAWRQHPLAREAENEDALNALASANAAALAKLAQQEDEQRGLVMALDAARHTEQECTAKLATATQAAHEAQVTLQAARNKRETADADIQTKTSQLDALLAELDSAFDTAAWRTSWTHDGAAFVKACAARVAAWNEQQQTLATLRADFDQTQTKHKLSAQVCETAARALATAQAALAAVDAEDKDLRGARAQLFAGRATAEVERDLDALVTSARQVQEAQRSALEAARQRETAARTQRELAASQITQARDAVSAAQSALDTWLAEPGRPTRDQLDAMLAHTADWIESERQALSAGERALADAQTVLRERRHQQETHAQLRPAPVPDDLQLAVQAREQAESAYAAAHAQLASVRLQLQQDDARRIQCAALLGRLQAQQTVCRRWAIMYELLGSQDGKKFRNYAQQFTLDVLLAYANRHLEDLARRYRLERVQLNGQTSLGLLVRDQDMGGELRAVHSLSGGETFLVSLALALGLASLSSNRIQVESLFIDEGFGSLDSETLRVAMDALDSLQAQGRKVGVISHVQEMSDRIATRIAVQPLGGGASRLSVL